jgi:hypothetical protein
MLEMRTIYLSTVGSANRGERVLKSGVNYQKIGESRVCGQSHGCSRRGFAHLNEPRRKRS